MPTVLRVGGFSFGFFTSEHDPAHVHVRYGGDVAIIEIETGHVRKSDLRAPDIARAGALVRIHRDELRAAWLEWKLKREG
ncbi:MAG TPA: DUF4160 domain-containing protein [Longimicrobium sp.]|nr:DUF4160 domain-containing protein [Longimicrobium sp.]